MPELPEVETLRRGLERNTLDRLIVDVAVGNAKVLKGQAEAAFRERVVGKRIARVDRRGKYLLVTLGGDPPASPCAGDSLDVPPVSFLCIHLKMRGQLLLQPAAEPAGPYHCITLFLDDGRVVRFHDMWTWGEMRALSAEEVAEVPGLAGMGPEPLAEGWGGAELAAGLAGRRGPIKPTLLDQTVVAGVGNIYADESLFRAGINPRRPANSLSADEADRLAREIRAVLTEAVRGGGTTSDEYVDLGGAIGRYTPKVYDRGGEPCPACATPLTRVRLGGRGTVFCGSCQPETAATAPEALPAVRQAGTMRNAIAKAV